MRITMHWNEDLLLASKINDIASVKQKSINDILCMAESLKKF